MKWGGNCIQLLLAISTHAFDAKLCILDQLYCWWQWLYKRMSVWF